MKNKLLLALLFISVSIFSQIDKVNTFKTISGFITFENKPLPYVSVFIMDSFNSTFTNSKGFYEIKAKVGETLIFEHIGLKTIEIGVEDITKTLNIKMRNKDVIFKNDKNKSLKLGGSAIGSRISKPNVINIDVDSLNQNALSLTDALLEKIPLFHVKKNKFQEDLLYVKGKELDGSVLWNIDNYEYDLTLPLFISELKSIKIITAYPKNWVINITTSINYSKEKEIDYDDYYFTNDDFYKNDAIPYKKLKKYIPEYIIDLKNTKKPEDFLLKYENLLKTYKKDTQFYSYVINCIPSKKKFDTIIEKVLEDFQLVVLNDPESLKMIAYKYQEINKNEKALKIYKKIANLRPNYKQSYRDLANAYLNLNNYKNFSLIYNNYFRKGFQLENDDIGNIMSSEIISVYNKNEEDTSYKRIKIDIPNKIVNSDVRLVFEWNTIDADFKLEFINPENEIFEVENSLYNNNALINDQKKKGYSSKEVIIEKLRGGNWLVNFTYLGNKKNTPTVLKVTSYYNWGRKNQSKKVNVFEFNIENQKTQLLKIN